MRTLRSVAASILVLAASCMMAQTDRLHTSWTLPHGRQAVSFFVTDSAQNVAERILAYQKLNGGWPANVNYGAYLGKEAMREVQAKKGDISSCSVANGSTLNEIRYLSQMYNATGRRRYRKAAEDGLEYLLSIQQPNGGWPAGGDGNSGIITFSDRSFVSIMEELIAISRNKDTYSYLEEGMRSRLSQALALSTQCMLLCQTVQDGKFAIWCSRYDAATLRPAATSGSIPEALSPRESASILKLLMSISNPDDRIVKTVEEAVAWFRENAIHGLSRENFVTKEGKRDYRFKEDRHAPDLWASYCDISDNSPIYTEADGTRVDDVSKLSQERRNQLSWLINDGVTLLRQYEKWKLRLKGQ